MSELLELLEPESSSITLLVLVLVLVLLVSVSVSLFAPLVPVVIRFNLIDNISDIDADELIVAVVVLEWWDWEWGFKLDADCRCRAVRRTVVSSTSFNEWDTNTWSNTSASSATATECDFERAVLLGLVTDVEVPVEAAAAAVAVVNDEYNEHPTRAGNASPSTVITGKSYMRDALYIYISGDTIS